MAQMIGEHMYHILSIRLDVRDNAKVLVWMMTLPNCLISFHIKERKFCSADYVKLLIEKVLPITMFNIEKHIFFQEDKAFVHQSNIVQKF